MNHAERRDYLRRIEDLASSDPRAYDRKVSAMMWRARLLLHGVLAFALITIVAAPVTWWYTNWINLLTVALLVTAGVMVACLMSQVLFIATPASRGIELPRQLHPLLFRDLRELRKKVRAPRFQAVRFTLEFNAAITPVPRLRGLLPARTTLLIGLPLLHVFSRQEFLTILAHELGHLSRNHSRFMRAAWRMRRQLVRLRQQLAPRFADGRDHPVARWFLDFLERFDLATRRLQREHELEADRLACQTNPPADVASSLCRMHALGRFFEETLMREVANGMIRSDIPRLSLLQEFLRRLEMPEMAATYTRDLRKDLRARTELEDSRPCLAERLRAIDQEPPVAWGLPAESAAKAYFARDCASLTARFDKAWVSWIAPLWRARFQESRRAAQSYRTIQAKQSRKEKLTPSELWALGVLEERLALPSDAVKSYDRFLAVYPDALGARLPLGRLLLDTIPDRAEKLLLEAVARHPLYWHEAAHCLRTFYLEADRPQQADDIEAQIEAHMDYADEAFDERLKVRRTDEHVVPELSKPIIDGVYRLAGELASISKLWVLEHTPKHFADVRAFVVVFTPDAAARKDPALVASTAQALAGETYLPGTVLVVDGSRYRWLKRRAEGLPNADIYSGKD